MSAKSEWVQVGELAKGFAPDSNKLEFVEDLSGKTLDLHINNGTKVKLQFETGKSLTWIVEEGQDKGTVLSEQYTATSIRENIYFVDYISSKDQFTSVSLVMDFATGRATILKAQLPTEAETMRSAFARVLAGDLLTGVDAEFLHASIDRPFTPGDAHTETEELIGRRVQYTYSPHEVYEHIYLNPSYYCWQCLKGVEKNLADTDRCHYYKIADKLYFFVWREKIVPTVGVVMIDLERLKTTGKILGYEGTDFRALNNFHVGAFARPLNKTVHDL